MIVYSHSDCLDHQPPGGHPECAARMQAVGQGLEGLSLERREAPPGEEAEVLRCHPQSYLDRMKTPVAPQDCIALDGDTWLSPGSHRAAMRAVGGITAAVDAVLAGEDATAFVAARPPGHHAETARAMGFCLYGTAAIGVKRALDHHGLARVALIDFDVHHGNGSQDLLWDEARCFLAGSQQMPLFPGTGSAEERGAHNQILNLALRPSTDGAHMRRLYEQRILPALSDYRPELLIVSAGFDAHARDPLAQLEWQSEDFAWLGSRLFELSGGRMVSTLEGGYDLPALAASTAAYIGAISALAK
ncbi:histone deacetylase family protein [Pseudogemmobacter faecipullorum]|uniref:histone deacetylase family protein n=1 Tax=Pseudogemmobacter faecipullorum TaxID=2755041 RepID=UPI001D0215BA|nr:histone deacetylase family protein [Pseudogemmobacter faecipullorum]